MTLPHHQPIPARFVSSDAAAALRIDAAKLPGWVLTPRQIRDLALVMNGGFHPLRGFLTQADFDAVHGGTHLTTGALWPVPVVLDVAPNFADAIAPGQDIALKQPDGTMLAIMSVTDQWQPDPASFLLGGPIKGLQAVNAESPTPNDLRAASKVAGWSRVLAVYSDDPNLAQAERVSRNLQAALQILPADHLQHDDAPRHAILRGLVACNHGATHLLLNCGDDARAAYHRHQDQIGVELIHNAA